MLFNIVVVFTGGAMGAVSRYLISSNVNQRAQRRFPLGTFTVNLIGSIIIGIIAQRAQDLGTQVVLWADVGFVGAFTTFSSLAYETVILLEQGFYLEALPNPTLSVILGLCGVSLGFWLGRAAI
jgi:CrcB protein